jgi:hypothetical protein
MFIDAGLTRCLRRVVSGTLYAAAARRWLNNASDFIAWIARIILSVRGSDSRSCCCDIVRSGGKRCGLGKVRHFSGVRHSVTGYVMLLKILKLLLRYRKRKLTFNNNRPGSYLIPL